MQRNQETKGKRASVSGTLANLVLVLGSLFLGACDRSPGRVVGRFELEPGRRLFLYCTGPASTPTVVLDAGAGGTIFSLHDLFADVSERTRVCAWDRPGLGLSDPPPEPVHSGTLVEDLRALLSRAGIPPPYLLVGHSFGGMNMRLLAGRHRDEVAGLVLIDSSHPDQFDRFAEVLPPRRPGESLALRDFRTRDFGNPDVDMETSLQQVRSAGSLEGVPVRVVSRADDPSPFRIEGLTPEVTEALHREWMEMQAELVALSSRGRQSVARSAGHCVHCTEPELVTGSILELLQVARGDES